jgi:hypothetical protein
MKHRHFISVFSHSFFQDQRISGKDSAAEWPRIAGIPVISGAIPSMIKRLIGWGT